MFNKILVPLDGSELAERALDPALTIARARDAELLLLSVSSYHQVLPPAAAGYGLTATDQIFDRGRNDASDYLDALRREARCGDCRIQTMAVEGDVAGCILDTAAADGVDLIVMTTHGYSGITRWMLGSITERVLRGASCPVLVVRQAIPLCKALINLDGSSLAEEALAPGLELARILGCQVTLLRADQGEDLSSVEQGLLQMAGAGPCQELVEGTEDRLSHYLECLARQHRSPDKRQCANPTGRFLYRYCHRPRAKQTPRQTRCGDGCRNQTAICVPVDAHRSRCVTSHKRIHQRYVWSHS